MIDYQLRRLKRSKYVRISIRDDASILVTAPKHTSIQFIETFIREKRGWITRKQQEMKQYAESLLADHSKEQFDQYKKEALKTAKKKVGEWNKVFEFKVNEVRVKRMRTQWGSCSSNKNLNFNYKIYFLPEELQDYLVVHEICHLKEMNHSAQFWKLVGQAIPDYKQKRKILKNLK